MVLLCVIFTCAVNKERTFWAGFWQSYVFLNAFSFFDALQRHCNIEVRRLANDLALDLRKRARCGDKKKTR